tara:strand:+ start:6288 stop:7205 length:918 start_codon:yes stop_codon:yes gene_type:complete
MGGVMVFLQLVYQVMYFVFRNVVLGGLGVVAAGGTVLLLLSAVIFPGLEAFSVLSPLWQSIYFSCALCLAMVFPFLITAGHYDRYEEGRHLAVTEKLSGLPSAVTLTKFLMGLMVVCLLSYLAGDWRVTHGGYTRLMASSLLLGVFLEIVGSFVHSCAERKIFRDFVTSIDSSWVVKKGDDYADEGVKQLKKSGSITVLKGDDEIQVYPTSDGLLTEHNDFVGSDVFLIYAELLRRRAENMAGQKGGSTLWYLPTVRNTSQSIEASFIAVVCIDGEELCFGYKKDGCSRIFGKPELGGFVELKSA